MQCNQLTRLVKEWYLHVTNETMAPARMMQFVDQHVNDCELCQQDPDLHQEIEKVREFVLPDSKLPKAFRAPNKALTPDISPTVAAAPKPDEVTEPVPDPENPVPET